MLQTVPPTLLQATSDPHLQQRLLDTPRQVSCGVPAPSYGSWCTRFCCALQESISQSCVSSASSMAGLMANSSKRTYAIPTPRSPFPVAEHCQPIPPQEMLKQFCLSLCGDSGSWPAQGSFEPSEHLWREWGLILNMNSPLLPSCWGCSFALRHRISPHSRSSVYRLTRFSLTLDVGYLLMAAPSDFGCGFICIVMLIYH